MELEAKDEGVSDEDAILRASHGRNPLIELQEFAEKVRNQHEAWVAQQADLVRSQD